MDFSLADERVALRETVRRFAQAELVPLAAELERDNRPVPRDMVRRYAEMGLLGINTPEALGGLGLTNLDALIVLEELAKVSSAVAFPVFEACVGPVRAIQHFAPDALVRGRWAFGRLSGLSPPFRRAGRQGHRRGAGGKGHARPQLRPTRDADGLSRRALGRSDVRRLRRARREYRRPGRRFCQADGGVRPRALRQCHHGAGPSLGRAGGRAWLCPGAAAVRQAAGRFPGGADEAG